MSNKPQEKSNIPAGNVNMKVRILDTLNIGESVYYNAEVEEINGYGVSTPPLSVGQKIKIHFPSSAFDKKEIAKDKQLNIRASWNNAIRKSGNAGSEPVEHWSFEFFNEN